MASFNDVFSAARKQVDVTLEALSLKTRIAESTLSKIGHRNQTLDAVSALAIASNTIGTREEWFRIHEEIGEGNTVPTEQYVERLKEAEARERSGIPTISAGAPMTNGQIAREFDPELIGPVDEKGIENFSRHCLSGNGYCTRIGAFKLQEMSEFEIMTDAVIVPARTSVAFRTYESLVLPADIAAVGRPSREILQLPLAVPQKVHVAPLEVGKIDFSALNQSGTDIMLKTRAKVLEFQFFRLASGAASAEELDLIYEAASTRNNVARLPDR